MEIAKGIHHFDTGAFNWYLIEEDGRLTLVDAGFPGHYRTFLKGLASLGRSIKDIEAVLITHAHADHMGFAARVGHEAKAPIFVHQDDLAKAGRTLQLPWYGLLSNAWRPYTASMLAQATINGVFTLPSIKEAIGFKDGDVLDVPGRPRVIHIPGHTAGEVAFHLSDRNVLLSGDALVTRDLFTGRGDNPQLPHHLLNDDTQRAHSSLSRLREVGQVTLLPGHGKPWVGEISEAIEIAHELLG